MQLTSNSSKYIYQQNLNKLAKDTHILHAVLFRHWPCVLERTKLFPLGGGGGRGGVTLNVHYHSVILPLPPQVCPLAIYRLSLQDGVPFQNGLSRWIP